MLLSIFFPANVNLYSCIFFFLFLDKEYLMIVIQDPSRPWSKAFVPLYVTVNMKYTNYWCIFLKLVSGGIYMYYYLTKNIYLISWLSLMP